MLEIDGEFHRQDVYKDGSFERLKSHDRLKDEFAFYEDIPLFRIKYDKGAFLERDIDELKEFVRSCLSFEKLIQSLV